MPTVKDLNAAGAYIEQMVSEKINGLVEQMAIELIDYTPICTGYARASWFVTPNAPKMKNDIKPLPEFSACLHQFPPRYPDMSRFKKNYSEWYIVNLAPYIRDLNEGSSKQADAGWIDDITTKYGLKGLGI